MRTNTNEPSKDASKSRTHYAPFNARFNSGTSLVAFVEKSPDEVRNGLLVSEPLLVGVPHRLLFQILWRPAGAALRGRT